MPRKGDLIAVGVLAAVLIRFQKRARVGDVFLALMTAYFAFRLAIDFLKPGIALLAGLVEADQQGDGHGGTHGNRPSLDEQPLCQNAPTIDPDAHGEPGRCARARYPRGRG